MIKKLQEMLTPKKDNYGVGANSFVDQVCIPRHEAAAIFKVLLAVSNLLDSDWVGTPEGMIPIKAQVFKDVVDSWEGLGK